MQEMREGVVSWLVEHGPGLARLEAIDREIKAERAAKPAEETPLFGALVELGVTCVMLEEAGWGNG